MFEKIKKFRQSTLYSHKYLFFIFVAFLTLESPFERGILGGQAVKRFFFAELS